MLQNGLPGVVIIGWRLVNHPIRILPIATGIGGRKPPAYFLQWHFYIIN